MKTPVKIALAALGINLLSNLILIYPLGYLGIALATVLSAVFNAVCLLACLHRQKIWVLNLGWFKVLGSSVLGVCVMAGVLYFIEHQEVWTAWHALSRLWHLVGLLFLGGASYLITLGLLGARQWLKE